MTEVYTIRYNSLRNVTPPEEEAAGRKRYCGNAGAEQFFDIPDDDNIRDYFQEEVEGKPIKPRAKSSVNDAIWNQLDGPREMFPILNSGISLIAGEVQIDDKERKAKLVRPSIINGTQTRGVLREYFAEHPEDKLFPSVNFEVILCAEGDLIGEITIARNYQNAVQLVSTYGRRGFFDDLEKAIRRKDPSVSLRKSETHVGSEYLDTEKLVQVVTSMIPADVPMPRPSIRTERIRVYAYAQKGTCLKDFAEVARKPVTEYPEAKRFFEDIAFDAWKTYKQLRSSHEFSIIRAVRKRNGKVIENGVPDGIVFPILSALGKLAAKKANGHWELKVPEDFDLQDLCKQAKATYSTPGPGQSNPNVMGKELACYLNLHAVVDAYLKYRKP